MREEQHIDGLLLELQLLTVLQQHVRLLSVLHAAAQTASLLRPCGEEHRFQNVVVLGVVVGLLAPAVALAVLPERALVDGSLALGRAKDEREGQLELIVVSLDEGKAARGVAKKRRSVAKKQIDGVGRKGEQIGEHRLGDREIASGLHDF